MENPIEKKTTTPRSLKTAFSLFIGVIMLLALTAISYFLIPVDNTNNETIEASTPLLNIVYTDCATNKQADCANISQNLGLGESVEKTFSIKNETSVVGEYYLVFKELVNTFKNNDLVYTIYDASGNVLQAEKPVPYAATQAIDKYAYHGTIPANTTQNFKIVITFKEKTTDQNENSSATYSIKLGLKKDAVMNIVEVFNDLTVDTNSTDVITKTAPSGASCKNTLAYDGTTDNNLRYVGANPCNYVTFNGETAGWRIVGIMNNVDDGTGKLETRIKLVRATSLGYYSWDTSASGVNSGYGINDWTQADLKNELNGDYLDTTLTENTNWYNGRNNVQTETFDITKRLGLAAQGLIGNTKWYLGGMQYTNADFADLIPSTMYTLERGNKVWGSTSGQTCNDGYCPRSLNWTGKVALIYPSDYGYATSGGSTTSRNTCINSLTTCNYSPGESWTNNSYSNCKNNDYLKPSSSYNWLLSPYSNSGSYAFNVTSGGSVISDRPYATNNVLPSVYLKSDVFISSGKGTETDPYVIS